MTRKSASSTFKKWDQYVAEAERDPFQLPISDDETLIIPAPTGAALLQFAAAYRAGDAEAILVALCGEHWQRIESLVAKAGFEALQELSTDMAVFFGLTEEMILVGPGGGEVTEADPRKITKLIRAGYRVKGEAPASRA